MRVIKRKKGNEEYNYLQHSFRKGTKIITKEIYLGKEIPKNIESIKKDFRKRLQKELYEKLKQIKIDFQKNWKKIPKSIQAKELEEISIAFTYNTNAIEGSTITLDEARGIIHDHISPNKSLRDVKETDAHSKTFLEMLQSNEKISNKILLKWHKQIFNETNKDISGKYRNYLVRVGSYVAPDPEDVGDLMKSLIEFIDKKQDLNPVEISAIAHYRFEKIHPFGDGNGRIGRLIINHILWKYGYPMMIIEYKNRKSYYKALRGEEEDFVKYFIKRYVSVHKSRLK